MTKQEQKAVNKFVLNIAKHKNRIPVPSTRFDKKAKKGEFSFVVRVSDILKEWKKLRKTVEGKKNGK